MGKCPYEDDWKDAKKRKDGLPNLTGVKGEAQTPKQVIRNYKNKKK